MADSSPSSGRCPSGRHPFTLIATDGTPYLSPTKGTLGGHRRNKIFGLLDCPAAVRAIARGGYVTQRVFFLDVATATAAGYRPCASCMPDAYREWRSTTDTASSSRSRPQPSCPDVLIGDRANP